MTPTRILEAPYKQKNVWMLKTDAGVFNIAHAAELCGLEMKTLYHRLFKNLYWRWSDPDIFGPKKLKKWDDKTPTRIELECRKLGPRREAHDIKIGSWERQQCR